MNELQVFVIPTRLDRFENWQVLDYEFLPWANMIDMVLIAAWSVETAVLVVGKWAKAVLSLEKTRAYLSSTANDPPRPCAHAQHPILFLGHAQVCGSLFFTLLPRHMSSHHLVRSLWQRPIEPFESGQVPEAIFLT